MGLVLAVVAVFYPVVGFEFVSFDDDNYVYENPFVPGGLTLDSLAGSFTEIFNSMWHPLTMLSFVLDSEVYDMRPGGFHFTNLILHLANTILLFFVLRAMTGVFWPSAAVALLFGVHPLHVESVAWVSARKDVLSTFFWFATMGTYLWYTRTLRAERLALVLVLFVLGLMAKSMLITLPFLLFVLDFWPLERFRLEDLRSEDGRRRVGRLVLEKCVFLPIVAAFLAVSFFTQSEGGAISGVAERGLYARASNAVVGYAAYIVDMLWPTGLAFLYPLPKGGLHPAWQMAGAAALITLITVIAFQSMQKRPYVLTGWLWYIGTLVPVIGLVQLGAQARADRYTYVPLIGLFIVIAWLGAEWVAKRPRAKRATCFASAVVFVLLVITAGKQVQYWKNSEALYRRALAVTENNYTAHYNLALQMQHEGRAGDVIEQFEAVLVLVPNHVVAHSNLGAIYYERGDQDRARTHFTAAFEAEPDNPTNRSNMMGMAHVLLQAGKEDEAKAHLEEALRLVTDFDDARVLLESLNQSPSGETP